MCILLFSLLSTYHCYIEVYIECQISNVLYKICSDLFIGYYMYIVLYMIIFFIYIVFTFGADFVCCVS